MKNKKKNLKFLFWDVIKYKKEFSEWIKKWNLKWRDENYFFLRCLRIYEKKKIFSGYFKCFWKRRWITFEWDYWIFWVCCTVMCFLDADLGFKNEKIEWKLWILTKKLKMLLKSSKLKILAKKILKFFTKLKFLT